MHSLVCGFLLVGSLGAAFPAPLATSVDDNLKFSSGAIVSVDATSRTAVVKTAAGPVTFDLKQAKVMGADKQPRKLEDLTVGQQVNVYFHISNGAVVQEIDL